MAVSQLIEMRSRGKASLKRIGELLDAEPDVKDREDVKEPVPLKGNIAFRNLTFRYPQAEYDVLSAVTFEIKEGEDTSNVYLILLTLTKKTC